MRFVSSRWFHEESFSVCSLSWLTVESSAVDGRTLKSQYSLIVSLNDYLFVPVLIVEADCCDTIVSVVRGKTVSYDGITEWIGESCWLFNSSLLVTWKLFDDGSSSAKYRFDLMLVIQWNRSQYLERIHKHLVQLK